MLYQTLSHPKLLAIFIIVGIFCGLIFDVGNFIKFLFSYKKFPGIIIDFIQTSICLFFIFIVNLYFNYGEVRFFIICITLISFTLERLILGKLIAKLYNSCYNKLINLKNKIWGKIKDGKANKNN